MSLVHIEPRRWDSASTICPWGASERGASAFCLWSHVFFLSLQLYPSTKYTLNTHSTKKQCFFLNWIRSEPQTKTPNTCILPSLHPWCAAFRPLTPHHFQEDRPAVVTEWCPNQYFDRACVGRRVQWSECLPAALPQTNRGHCVRARKGKKSKFSQQWTFEQWDVRQKLWCSLYCVRNLNYSIWTNLSYTTKSESWPRMPMLPCWRA